MLLFYYHQPMHAICTNMKIFLTIYITDCGFFIKFKFKVNFLKKIIYY